MAHASISHVFTSSYDLVREHIEVYGTTAAKESEESLVASTHEVLGRINQLALRFFSVFTPSSDFSYYRACLRATCNSTLIQGHILDACLKKMHGIKITGFQSRLAKLTPGFERRVLLTESTSPLLADIGASKLKGNIYFDGLVHLEMNLYDIPLKRSKTIIFPQMLLIPNKAAFLMIQEELRTDPLLEGDITIICGEQLPPCGDHEIVPVSATILPRYKVATHSRVFAEDLRSRSAELEIVLRIPLDPKLYTVVLSFLRIGMDGIDEEVISIYMSSLSFSEKLSLLQFASQQGMQALVRICANHIVNDLTPETLSSSLYYLPTPNELCDLLETIFSLGDPAIEDFVIHALMFLMSQIKDNDEFGFEEFPFQDLFREACKRAPPCLVEHFDHIVRLAEATHNFTAAMAVRHAASTIPAYHRAIKSLRKEQLEAAEREYTIALEMLRAAFV